MTYQLSIYGNIRFSIDENTVLVLPPEDNGTPEWTTYKEWLAEGNEPLPADPE